MKKHRFNSFTLSEAIIVLVVLGIVASLTVPAVIKRQIQASNRAKIKKSIKVFDLVMNKMVIENDLKSNSALKTWAIANNCQNSAKYFKPVKLVPKVDERGNSTTTNCRFMTADKVFWDISELPDAVFALKDELDNKDSDTTFVAHAHFDNQGIFRVNDLAWEEAYSQNSQIPRDIAKMYNYPKKEIEEIKTVDKCKTGTQKSVYLDDYFQTVSFEKEYDDKGNLIKEVGTDEYDDNYETIEYNYENGRLISSVKKAGDDILSTVYYKPNGDIDYEITDANVKISYNYENGRISTVTNDKTEDILSYTYDEKGNLTKVTDTYNLNNNPPTTRTILDYSYTYDDNGNLNSSSGYGNTRDLLTSFETSEFLHKSEYATRKNNSIKYDDCGNITEYCLTNQNKTSTMCLDIDGNKYKK